VGEEAVSQKEAASQPTSQVADVELSERLAGPIQAPKQATNTNNDSFLGLGVSLQLFWLLPSQTRTLISAKLDFNFKYFIFEVTLIRAPRKGLCKISTQYQKYVERRMHTQAVQGLWNTASMGVLNGRSALSETRKSSSASNS
jgi:hypothetical protein